MSGVPWWVNYPYVNDEVLNLDWIVSHFNEFIASIAELEEWKTTHETEYSELLALYEEVKANWDDFAAGNFPDSTYEAMQTWWEENAVDIVGSLVKFVFFGLTDTGYFCAYIPENWSDINFDTIIDTTSEDYGKLCILY